MSGNAVSEERNIAIALISGLGNITETPTREQVEEKAKQIAAIFSYTGDLRNIITEAMISVDTRMGVGVSLVDIDAKHDDQWVHKREDITWTYADAYENHLRKEGWPPRMVQSLSDVTTRILGHLQDPLSEGTTWNRRGLVIGHVQSGKTANYTGLIAKAADAGYKFIIVIAGIHNNLRKQTQERIDEAFIGRSSDPENRRLVGVGLEPGYPLPATLTNVNEDFNKNTAEKSGWKINDFSKPIILVIKKNVSTLTALHKWLKELNAEGDGRISDVPMLLIDDEADNASANTNEYRDENGNIDEDADPTRTNGLIRKLLTRFEQSAYVGYTATPFANIFDGAAGDDRALVAEDVVGTLGCVLVLVFDEEPILALFHLDERPGAFHFVPLQSERNLAGCVFLAHLRFRFRAVVEVEISVLVGRVRPLVPNDDLPSAVFALRDRAFEARVVERVILDVHGHALFAIFGAGTFWNGPRLERPIPFEAKVVVKPARRVPLDHEAQRALATRLSKGIRLLCLGEIALLGVIFEFSHANLD